MPQAKAPGERWVAWLMTGAVVALLFVPLLFVGGQEAPYSDFKADVKAGKVSDVVVSSKSIRGHLKPEAPGRPAREFTTVRVDDPDLYKALEEAHVRVVGDPGFSFLRDASGWLLPLALWGGLFWAGRRASGRGPGGAFLSLGKSKARVYVERSIPVRFIDVAGVDEAKEELKEVIDFLGHPERFREIGAKLPKGILLVGPPGTGKTLLARAVAGEAQVPFFSISGSEFVEMFVGLGAARVRDLFEQARAKAPCIIFIDELDALGKVRSASLNTNDEREQTLNQLLVELDGFDPHRGVVLMAATNRPETLDPALLRAGRFDRHILVDRPDRAGRLAILRVHARALALEPQADLEGLASQTAGMAGADLANLLNEAALLAVRHRRPKVGPAELDEAVERVTAGLQKHGVVLKPRERERVAFHELGHALVALALPGTDLVKKISIIPRGASALGYTLQVPLEDRWLMTRGELLDKIAVLMGGRAAERLVFHEVSTGAQEDLARATEIARSMVAAYGMGERLGPLAVDPPARSIAQAGHPWSAEVTRRVDDEVLGLMEAEERRALEILTRQEGALRGAAALLLQKESLSGAELEELLRAKGGAVAQRSAA